MTLVVRAVLLVILWVLAWGDLSLANVLSGSVLAVVLLAAFPPVARTTQSLRPRPVAILRLLAYLSWQLVVSTAEVARAVLSSRQDVRSGVVAHRLADASEAAITMFANLVALTPGTMTVDTVADPPAVHVHILLLDDADAAHRRLARLEELGLAAMGRDARPPDPLEEPP